MAEWTVRRWARYGHERLYAASPDGTTLGYLDLKTGQYHSDNLGNLPLLETVIGDHLATRMQVGTTNGSVSPAETIGAATAVEPPAGTSVPQWEDISATQAGAAARQRALAAREAQGPFRHVLSRLVGARTDERAWRIGADGEQATAEQLAKLGPEWRVLHAVRVGDRGADIDHVVIGPPGVFTVNAKNHPRASIWVGGDTFLVNGQRVPYIRNSRYEARRAARLLTERAGFPVATIGVIAVMGAHKGFTVKKQPEDGAVVVVPRRSLGRYLQHRSARLGRHEISAIYEVARRSTTWKT